MSRVFVSAYCARGKQSFLNNLVSRLERLVLLSGPPGSGKATFMKQAALALTERGVAVQHWISPMDPARLEGITVPSLHTAILNADGTETWLSPGMSEIIDFRHFFQGLPPGVQQHSDVDVFRAEIEASLKLACEELERAPNESSTTEEAAADACWSPNMAVCGEAGWSANEVHYFGSAVTAEGLVDCCGAASSHCRRFLLLSGPPPRGEESMRRFALQALGRGEHTAIYHSGVRPSMILMVVAAESRIAVINATPYHPVCDTAAGDSEGTAFFSAADTSDTIAAAVRHLEQARQKYRTWGLLTAPSMDFEQVNRVREELLCDLLGLK